MNKEAFIAVQGVGSSAGIAAVKNDAADQKHLSILLSRLKGKALLNNAVTSLLNSQI
ncbi:hypothetical protein [uncultured Photobacterium sp.]|uniref:hypothetical protein n=1 Tax=uncultured Photobacterium sp. TaxID=173973 RepID=UPI002636CFDB|nr:hypothetical protein [uncultured Photobacterium sp.]